MPAGIRLIAACLCLAGCTQYLERSDRISFGAGDAIAANKAIQTIDPWSSASRDRRTVTSGERAQIAGRRYQTNTSLPPKGIGTSSAGFENAPAPSSSAPPTQ